MQQFAGQWPSLDAVSGALRLRHIAYLDLLAWLMLKDNLT